MKQGSDYVKKLKPILIIAGILAAIVLITLGCIWLYTRNVHYGFYKTVPHPEAYFQLPLSEYR